MRRVILLLLAVSLMVLSLSGCDSLLSSGVFSQKKIELTTENVYDYLTFHIKGYGTDSTWDSTEKDFYYQTLTMHGTIEGISGYTYEDVSLTVAVYFTYTWAGGVEGSQSVSSFTTLNVAGNGTVSASQRTLHNAYDIEKSYIVTSVSGYVIKE